MTKLSYRLLPFSKRLFLSVISLFAAFAVCFILFQYQRERIYKSDLLNAQLQDYNAQLFDFISEHGIHQDSLQKYLHTHMLPQLRLTLITPQGEVIYDSFSSNFKQFRNHLTRPEIQQAMLNKSGYAIRRTSESLDGEDYFYSAHYYPSRQLIVRSALPYNINLSKLLQVDFQYIWFTLIISLILIIVFYRFTHKLGMSITQLQQFALKADQNEPIDIGILNTFPKNELGEISQHIIKIYKRLHRAKEALYIEREKLISHLQTSHEGLGVFTKDKKEILVNNLFTQYANTISDRNLRSTEELFSIPEFAAITDLLNQNERQNNCGTVIKEEKRVSQHIHKNGRSFSLECIIFQDSSFEISISDITQEEEQAKLKRQLTQNIAHELKTPVSSIQGYLETLLQNPDIPTETTRIFLERSYAQSNRLTMLLRDISVLTRMDEAPDLMEKERINLSKLVENILNEVALNIEDKQITVDNRLPDNLIIYGNSSLLYSIFRNLTDNTIAYAGMNVTLKIHCFREDEKFYYFSVSDSGIGVPEEHLNRLFERFYRVDKGRSRKLGGTGLGLAIVKNAVLFHGGTIFAKNKPQGGLEFVFTLQKGNTAIN